MNNITIISVFFTIFCFIFAIVFNKYARERSLRTMIMAKCVIENGEHIKLFEDAMWINRYYGKYRYKIRRNFKNKKYQAVCLPRHKNSAEFFVESYTEHNTKEEAQAFIINEIEKRIIEPYSL